MNEDVTLRKWTPKKIGEELTKNKNVILPANIGICNLFQIVDIDFHDKSWLLALLAFLVSKGRLLQRWPACWLNVSEPCPETLKMIDSDRSFEHEQITSTSLKLVKRKHIISHQLSCSIASFDVLLINRIIIKNISNSQLETSPRQRFDVPQQWPLEPLDASDMTRLVRPLVGQVRRKPRFFEA